ncbi:hypothetical protein HS7_08880 [Sulfolobales archaeon HS-7]|nr:hypothetical protein HS7_08880 [Sulfolobales archaeon HS-7]
MSKAYTKWKCDICNEQIAWDELFTYLSNKAVVHFSCLKRKAEASGKADAEHLKAILNSLEEELNGIVNYKQRLGLIKDEEIKKYLEQAEKDAEKNAALFTRLVEKYI